MPEESPQININVKKVSLIGGAILTVVSVITLATSNFSSYHSKFAHAEVVDSQIVTLNKEIVTLAIQRYEDEIMGYNFLIETEKDTPLDRVAKSNAENRLRDLKDKLENLE
jgi:hypothetical protein